jgi:hypothetical protein
VKGRQRTRKPVLIATIVIKLKIKGNPLKPKHTLIIFKYKFSPQNVKHFSAKKMYWLMLCREINAVYSENLLDP